ncbi:hypothetical protein ES332_D13G101700v1 [Gossypium tomentosum]|uniref:Photosystem I n=1 Tax=Gossypium tomentosum TaxID=34277 RepID=A0A5D2HVB2_GOSTO|nr:hypothetical protein ES332_D13G101700v1 [Gossypium tomentosum]
MLAFGTLEKKMLIEPIFAQWIQSAYGKTSYGFDVLLSSMNGPTLNAGRSIWLPGWLNDVNENSNSLFLTTGLHTITLILVKGTLDARGSKLMPDKKDFSYSFPCDGPGQGGTCDISERSFERSNSALVRRIHQTLSWFKQWSIRHISREENSEADHLVKLVQHRTFDLRLFETSPLEGLA